MKKVIITTFIIILASMTSNCVYAARAQMFGSCDLMQNFDEWDDDTEDYNAGIFGNLFKGKRSDNYLPEEVKNASPTDPVFSGRDNVQSVMYNSVLTTDPRLAPYMGADDTSYPPRSVMRSTQNMPVFQKIRIKLMNKLRRHEEQTYLQDLEKEKKQLEEFENSLNEETEINNIFDRYKRSSRPKDIVNLENKVEDIVIEDVTVENQENEISEDAPKIVPLKGKLKEVRGENIIVLDAKNIYYVEADDEIVAENSAIIKFPRQKITVTADKFVYSNTNNIIKAVGNVKISSKGHTIYSDYAQVNVNEEEISIDNITADFNTTKVKAKNAISRDNTLYLYNGDIQSFKNESIGLKPHMVRGIITEGLIPVEEEDKYYIQKSIIKDSSSKIFADKVVIDAKDDHDVISLKNSKLYYGNNKVFNLRSLTLYSDKAHSTYEGSYPEFSSISQLGSFLGPGFAFEVPHAGVAKFIPFINRRKSNFGLGAALRYRSANNFTEIAYGSVSDIIVARGYQFLDDKLTFRYGMNSFMDEWFLGPHRAKYAAELVYADSYNIPHSLKKGLNLNYKHMASLGYYHNSMYNINYETFKDNNFGTTRGRYMAQIQQDLYNYYNREQHARFNLSALLQGSAAIYGNGDTQYVGRIGLNAHSQYKYWVQNISYFLTGFQDHSPMQRFDAYRYGTSSVQILEAVRLCKFLSLAWSGLLTLSNDAPNEKMVQENAFMFMFGPDDFKVILGYDYIRKRTYITLGITLDTSNSKLDYNVMEIKNPDKLGDDSEGIEELAPAFWLIPEPKAETPKYQNAQVISLEEDSSKEYTD